MKLLYIPFSAEDTALDLYPKAMQWLENQALKNYEDIIILNGSDRVANHQEMSEALKNGECTIYILSHGLPIQRHVIGNQSSPDEYFVEITIEEAAQRFQEDFINPLFDNNLNISTFSDNNIVKLFFCDEYTNDAKAHKMAEKFLKSLGADHQSLDVQYYSDVKVSIPDKLTGSKKAVRFYRLENDILCFRLHCHVGKPKYYRHSLKDQDPNIHCFFNANIPSISPVYPQYEHPLLKQFAMNVIAMVLSDKTILENKETIIKELLLLLPTRLEDYLVDKLKLSTENIRLELDIDVPKLILFLRQNKIPVPEHIIKTYQKPNDLQNDANTINALL